MFGTILLLACTVMQIYVFWRVAAVPLIARHVSRKYLLGAGIILWAGFLFARFFERSTSGIAAWLLEFLSMNWMAALFLVSVALLAVDLVTGFGFLMRRLVPSLRGWALVAGGILSIIALVQGLRPPVVREYEVWIAGLPAERDGTVIVAMSDLHLGTLLGAEWLAARVDQVQAQRPDLIALLGDQIEGHGQPDSKLQPVLRRLSAPLGVWAVAGNHESHGGSTTNLRLLEEIGIQVLRDRWAEVRPGLVLAGVTDLTSRRRSGQSGDPIAQALANRPPGAAILLSHTPWQAEKAASAGAGLMLCGHTHDGQIWPLYYLIRFIYPLMGGRYEVGGMPVIVCRGTGTWGPRMRLWRPSEILRIILRAPKNSLSRPS